jgi:hypothetical protein
VSVRARVRFMAWMYNANIASAALQRLRARGDCFQEVTASLQHGCNTIQSLAITKVQCKWKLLKFILIDTLTHPRWIDAVALTDCELRTANHSLPTLCTGTSDEQLLLSCVSCVSVRDVDYNRLVISNVSFISSLAQVPQWWTSYSGKCGAFTWSIV